jgi:hypothetical protein
MKNLKIKYSLVFFALAFLFSGCYKLQKDYKYEKYELDPHYDMTAKQFLLTRGANGVGSDTVFKWMQMGIEYAGIDISEYEKTGRTFIFLHNNAIKVWDNTKKIVTGGFFFDYPIMVKDSSNNPIKSKIDPTMDSTRPAMSWNEYPKEMVKNYFLYLIINGEFGFDNLHIENQAVTTLLPPGSVASPKDSRLGWVVTKTSPNPDVTAIANITLVYPTGGTGFDPEGKMNLKIGNNDASPIVVNDRSSDRTAGYYFTNGRVHVYDKTIHPFRYSWQ